MFDLILESYENIEGVRSSPSVLLDAILELDVGSMFCAKTV
jgi:hypothetical protein